MAELKLVTEKTISLLNEKCPQWRDRCSGAYFQALIQTFLREEHKINIAVVANFACYQIFYISKYNATEDENVAFDLEGLDFKDFNTYEEALEESIVHALTYFI